MDLISPLAGDRVLITGATGFIGSRLAARLVRAGADVHAVMRPGTERGRLGPIAAQIHTHIADLKDREAVTRLTALVVPRYIFHLATYRSAAADNYRDAYETNVLGLLNLLEGTPASVVRFVHFASSTEYGASNLPAREDDALNPTSLHGLSKAAATQLCRQYAGRTGLPLVVLRLFHVYGPWDRPTRFIPQLVTAALEGKPIALTPPGFRHDWTYVEDVVDATLAAAAAPLDCGEVINVASGQDWTNEEIRSRIERLSGQAIAVDARAYPPRPWDTTRWVADVSKARRLLGWTPAHHLDDGLSRTIDWHRTKRELDRAS